MPKAKRKTQNAKIDIDKIAKLANLPLTQDEEKLYQKQLEEILRYVDQIEGKVTESDVEPIFNVSKSQVPLAEDKVSPSVPQTEALRNASNIKDGYIVTRGVFAEE